MYLVPAGGVLRPKGVYLVLGVSGPRVGGSGLGGV